MTSLAAERKVIAGALGDLVNQVSIDDLKTENGERELLYKVLGAYNTAGKGLIALSKRTNDLSTKIELEQLSYDLRNEGMLGAIARLDGRNRDDDDRFSGTVAEMVSFVRAIEGNQQAIYSSPEGAFA